MKLTVSVNYWDSDMSDFFESIGEKKYAQLVRFGTLLNTGFYFLIYILPVMTVVTYLVVTYLAPSFEPVAVGLLITPFVLIPILMVAVELAKILTNSTLSDFEGKYHYSRYAFRHYYVRMFKSENSPEKIRKFWEKFRKKRKIKKNWKS
jgi:hypothetical protein